MNRSSRASFAKTTVNIDLPRILNSSPRARAGIANTALIHYTQPTTLSHPSPKSSISSASEPTFSPKVRTQDPSSQTKPKVSVIQADTFSAAHTLLSTLRADSNSKLAVLNMASPYSPGGGFINGAIAQEEALCARSTLYAALTGAPDASMFYRIPSLSAVYTPDSLVFRSEDLKDLPKGEQYFVDVITMAAIRQPDLIPVSTNANSSTTWNYEDKDREEMLLKIRALFNVAKEKEVTHLVLGAWGCGAYGNPPQEVAQLFRKVLLGDKRREDVWKGSRLVEILFAIFDKSENLRIFEQVLGEGITDGDEAVL